MIYHFIKFYTITAYFGSFGDAYWLAVLIGNKWSAFWFTHSEGRELKCERIKYVDLVDRLGYNPADG